MCIKLEILYLLITLHSSYLSFDYHDLAAHSRIRVEMSMGSYLRMTRPIPGQLSYKQLGNLHEQVIKKDRVRKWLYLVRCSTVRWQHCYSLNRIMWMLNVIQKIQGRRVNPTYFLISGHVYSMPFVNIYLLNTTTQISHVLTCRYAAR